MGVRTPELGQPNEPHQQDKPNILAPSLFIWFHVVFMHAEQGALLICGMLILRMPWSMVNRSLKIFIDEKLQRALPEGLALPRSYYFGCIIACNTSENIWCTWHVILAGHVHGRGYTPSSKM